MLPIQTAELINRVRRAFGLRGQLGIDVESLASPVVPLFDASGAPFRSDGIEWWGSQFLAALAGNFGDVAVVADISNIRAVVDQIIIANINAAPASFIGFLQGRTYATGDCTSSESEGATIQGPNVPIDLVSTTGAASYTATSPRLFTVQLPAQTSLVIPCEIALITIPGIANRGLTVQTGAVNQDCCITYRGRYWKGAQA